MRTTDRLALAGVVATFLTLTFATTANATEQGWYLGGSFGQSDIVEKDVFDDFCDTVFVVCGDKDTDTAYKAIVGYQVNNYVGLEAAYFDLGNPSVSTTAPIVVDAIASFTGGSFSVLPQVPIAK